MGIVNPWVNPTNCQCVRAQTDDSGVLTWEFETPYESGVVPVVTAMVETDPDATDVMVAQLSGAPTKGSVTIRVMRLIDGIPESAGAQWVHFKAEAP